jgi:hypothetical protein
MGTGSSLTAAVLAMEEEVEDMRTFNSSSGVLVKDADLGRNSGVALVYSRGCINN